MMLAIALVRLVSSVAATDGHNTVTSARTICRKKDEALKTVHSVQAVSPSQPFSRLPARQLLQKHEKRVTNYCHFKCSLGKSVVEGDFMRRSRISAVWSFTLPLMFVMSFCAHAETTRQTAQSYVEMGEKFASHGDFVRAIGAYTIALQFAPDSAEAHFRRGQAFQGHAEAAKAIADYSAALNLRPNLTSAWYNRGNLRMKGGDYEGALSDLDKAVETNPDYARAYNNRGVAKVANGDLDGAFEDFAQAIKLDPRDPDPFVNRGLLRFRQGLKAEADEDFARSIAIDPSLKGFIEARLSHATFTPAVTSAH
jgi:Tfp pilus assembly protein PilF